MQASKFLLVSVTALIVTLGQGHPVHFPRPILSLSKISKEMERAEKAETNWKHKVTPDTGDLLSYELINAVYHFYVLYSLTDKLSKYDRNMFHSYVAFFASDHRRQDTHITTVR